MNTIAPSWEERLALVLDGYIAFRVILSIRGLRFTSESIERHEIERMLLNQPAGMQAIEGRRSNSFTPDDWEEIAI